MQYPRFGELPMYLLTGGGSVRVLVVSLLADEVVGGDCGIIISFSEEDGWIVVDWLE